MKKAADIFKDNGYYDYKPIIESFGSVVVQVDDKDYQGDSRVLLKDQNGRYGLLFFGWGSCSGCDALQGCSNDDEVDELIQKLHDDTKWFRDGQDCLDYIENKDWELDYHGRSSETKEFLSLAKSKLSKLGRVLA